MKVEIDIYSAAELRALGTFATALADARVVEEIAKRDMLDKMPGLGGIVGAPFWQGHTAGGAVIEPQPPVDNEHVAEGATPFTEAEIVANSPVILADAPKRERGKPSPGHKRRTNAEIAEDDAAANAPAIATMVTLPNDASGEQVADAFANLKAGISTGEERVGPEDTPEDQAQDAADEAAETAAATALRVAEGKSALTLDDIRTVLGNYQKAYGLPACMEDCPKVISEVCGDGKVKVSDVPDDKIAAVIEALKAAGRTNAFGRTALVAA